MVDSTTTSTTLVAMLPDWHFDGIDAFGRSGDLITGWHSRSMKLLNSWALNSCLGVDLFVEGLGREFRILNIYGPYLERTPFWESIFKFKLLKVDNSILGGRSQFFLRFGGGLGPKGTYWPPLCYVHTYFVYQWSLGHSPQKTQPDLEEYADMGRKGYKAFRSVSGLKKIDECKLSSQTMDQI